MKKYILPVACFVTIILLGILIVSQIPSQVVVTKSVVDSNAYNATSTYFANGTPTFGTNQVVKTSGGMLGSVVITGAVAGALKFYDATSTTDTASTTITIIPASAAANTYVFDTAFSRGLIVSTTAGLVPTTTITYR